MTREEAIQQIQDVVDDVSAEFAEDGAERLAQMRAHAATVQMAISHLHEERERRAA